MKTLFKTSLVALMLPLCAGAYTNLQLNDPRDGGVWSTGTIDKATIDIVPQGEYAMYDLHLVLSATATKLADGDSLEITCNFDLPAGAYIKSASLLIDGVWTEGALMPRNEAHAIYEGVVQRRRDPLIIYKNYGDNYLFKIFPIVTGDTREMKLRYAVPAGTDGGNKSLSLPWDLINASASTPDLKINIAKSDDFTAPSIEGTVFTETQDGYTATVTPDSYNAKPSFTSDIAAGNIHFDYSRGEAGIIYKLDFVPSQLFELNTGKKVLFIVDNDNRVFSDTSYSYTSVYDETTGYYTTQKSIKNIYKVRTVPADTIAKHIGKMLGSLDTNNSFNIVVKNSGVYTYSSDWKPCTSANIADAVKAVVANSTSYTADMKKLIASSADLINEENVIPVIISNNRQFDRYSYTAARTYAQELVTEVPLNKALRAFDISNTRIASDDTYYYYSSYRYSNLLNSLVSLYSPNSYSYPYTVYQTSYFEDYFPTFYESDQSRIVLLEVASQSDLTTVYDKTVGTFVGLPYNNYTEMGKLDSGTVFKAVVSFRYKGQRYTETYTFPIGDAQNEMLEDASAVLLIDALNNSGDEYAKLEAKKLSGQYQVLTRNSAILSIDPDAVVTPCWDCPDWNNWFVLPWNGGPIRMFDVSNSMDFVMEKTTMTTGDITTLDPMPSVNLTAEEAYSAGFKVAESNCISNSTDLYNAGYEEGMKAATVISGTSEEPSATFTASPNPFTNELTVSVKDGGTAKITIVDAAGNLVLSETFEGTITLDAKNSAFSALKSGLYVVNVTTDTDDYSVSVLKE